MSGVGLSVGLIGVRSGETLVSAPKAKQNKGSIMKIKGFFPPLTDWNLTPEEVRDKLNLYTFFNPMTVAEREKWIVDNKHANKDLYLQDVDLYIKFISLSGEFVAKSLTPDQINYILAGNPNDPEGYWHISEIYNMFPKKPNSRAKRHTLIFRPGNWVVLPDYDSKNNSYNGICVDAESGVISMQNVTSNFAVVPIAESRKSLNSSITDIAITWGSNKNLLNLKSLDSVLTLTGRNIPKEIIILLNWCPPSVHKSLIQKILRTRCTHVSYCDKLYQAEDMLLASFCMLLCHPGAFVPNIQRFVSGIESALKRLAVSIFEDAYTPNGDMLTSLLASSWLAQNVPSWTPTEIQLKNWCNIAIEALNYPHMFKYDWHNTTGVIKEWSSWYMSFYLLSSIRSFDSDERMVCSIAENNGSPILNDIRDYRVMPLVHCIDHHSYTDIAHYLPPYLIATYENYGELFKDIWNNVVGKNPRKTPFDFVKGDDFFTDIRVAQTLIWICKSSTPIHNNDFTDITEKLTYKLDDGWLSSFVGSREIKIGTTTAIAIIHPDDILSYVAVKRPSRDVNISPELTPEEKEQALAIFRQILIDGVNLTNSTDTLPMFKGGQLNLINDDYFITTPKIRGYWSTIKNLSFDLPVINTKPIIQPLYQALTETSDGVYRNAHTKFRNYLETLDSNIIQRTITYLSYNTLIDIYHIGRDGKGTEYSVNVTDTGVNWLLSMICVLYPAALTKDGSKFRVKNGPLMWSLHNIIKQFIPRPSGYKWKIPSQEKRHLWEHQIEAIDTLVKSRDAGKKVRIIWIPPGLGKTAIIVNYIANCIQNNLMPKYCVYTLPPSAMATIEREFGMRNIPFIHLDMRSAAKGEKQLVPGTVNIIYHDHLRMAPSLKNYAPEMMFIVDEFHKTLNATIRTSIALELAHLSADVIALTGTLIKDTHVEPVIAWLSQSVNFEVTPKNYWVALSSIISRKVYTKIIVERLIEEASLTDIERDEYYKLVPPNLGGSASSINFRAAVDISYNAITRHMIDRILLHVNIGLGVFVVARNMAHALQIQGLLQSSGVHNIFVISTGHSISLTPTDPPPGTPVPQVVIATPSHAEGYNLTRFNVMITGVYFTNQATREQLEARINRIDSISPTIRIMVIHAGIISYIHANYEKARSLSAALKGFAKDVNLPSDTILDL